MNTIAMLTKLFPKTKNISEVAEILEKYSNFGINTNIRLAHFLAQVREVILLVLNLRAAFSISGSSLLVSISIAKVGINK